MSECGNESAYCESFPTKMSRRREKSRRRLFVSLLIPSTFVAASSADVRTVNNINQRHLRRTPDYHPMIDDDNTISPRIINGRKVDHASDRFPYFVSLRDNYDYHLCGGTLIAPDIVLTAAHCL
jgi:V8-like Glu-specific endopeptidase